MQQIAPLNTEFKGIVILKHVLEPPQYRAALSIKILLKFKCTKALLSHSCPL